MKISKLTIQNFRCYYGTKVVEFDTDGKITLIYGLSGAGKTSFLQFINWVLYGKNDFAKRDENGKIVENFPIYNMKLDDETPRGSTFDVKGTIDFNHNGVDYQVIRSETYRKSFSTSTKDDSDFVLLYSDNGNWVEYTEDIPSKINEIVPRALSKYFFFHGEKMDLLNNEDSDLKDSIYNLFGLNKYEAAISHLGDKKTSQTVIHKYYNERNKKLSATSTDDSTELFSKMSKCKEIADNYHRQAEQFERKEKYFSSKAKEIVEEIGKKKSSGAFEQTIKTNNNLIKSYETQIKTEMYSMGKCLYKSVPYLLLSELTKNSVKLLAAEANSQESKKTVVFKNLKKDLLKEILEKNVCICNRSIDDEARSFIQNTIDSMPPDSYIYQLKQFASKSSDYIRLSQPEYDEFDTHFSNVTELRNKILGLNEDNKKLTEDLKKIDDTKDLAAEYESLTKKEKEYNSKKNEALTNEKKFKDASLKFEAEYDKVIENKKIKSIYDEKIELLEKIKKVIEEEFDRKVDSTVKTLEESILDVYKILSTRKEDFDKINFLQDNFALRNVSRTGGQEAIDVYSYIIGMIKALHQLETDSKEKEFPIIIDAPFSHTDVIQANHVFETLPEIAPQVIILSLELDKFRSSIDDNRVGHVYVITSNETQTIADINCCTISKLLEIEAENAKRAVRKES